MDPRQTLTAAYIVNTWGEEEIANVLFEYGEERKSRAMECP
jgi:16S rRNA C1402 N4-methylase RsmH